MKSAISVIAIILLTLLSLNEQGHARNSSASEKSELERIREELIRAGDSPQQTLAENECPSFAPPRMLRLLKKLPKNNPCEERGTSLVALTDIQVVFLCRHGFPVANYDFAIGSKGLDKRTEGDRKTPIGVYPLGKPRVSDKFKTFIPIGYPTLEQVQKGYTGDAIGLHGPSRFFRCAGFLNVLFNWTKGCLAVADDGFIDEIASFVEQHSISEIHILTPHNEPHKKTDPTAPVPSLGPDPDSATSSDQRSQ